ncbi:hypothetical protein ROLI_033460 [Roseobacter fucihabitans]|uniref:Uncharacterized protein n=1 Tax=Roseobacter fucihabitans TaxID=1537242 RepID=A0ABZ2BW01_9RHOB|nr:hypothetical protein [Roseobacter litoralis]MBC6966764.1 hypothetical protein [Roseobacter litoralis]
MDISRPPNFNEIYPTLDTFDRALEAAGESLQDSTGRLSGGSPLDPAEIEKMIANTMDAPDAAFSTRHFSEAFARAMHTRISPSCLGRIENLLITVPYYRDGKGNVSLDPREVRHFRTLIAALGDNREYTIVCHPDTRPAVETWSDLASGIHLNIVEMSKFNFTIWAQDAYVGLRGSSGQQILAEGILFPRQDDMAVADEIATQTNISALQSYLYFQGGNILGGSDLTLVGMDYMIRNLGRFGLKTVQDIAGRYASLFGTDILFLGGADSGDFNWYQDRKLTGYGTQPIFHIDMYVTRTGVTGNDGKEIVFLGRPKFAKDIVGTRPEQGGVDIDRYDSFFEQTEQQLNRHFEVRHLPLFMVHGNVNGEGYRAMNEFYNLTFNNVVIENFDGTKNVVLSTYADDVEAARFGVDPQVRRDLEQAAQDEWKRIGYTVHRTDSHEILSHAMSSIHCITKTVRRGSFP